MCCLNIFFQVNFMKGFYNPKLKCFQHSPSANQRVSLTSTSLAVMAILKVRVRGTHMPCLTLVAFIIGYIYIYIYIYVYIYIYIYIHTHTLTVNTHTQRSMIEDSAGSLEQKQGQAILPRNERRVEKWDVRVCICLTNRKQKHTQEPARWTGVAGRAATAEICLPDVRNALAGGENVHTHTHTHTHTYTHTHTCIYYPSNVVCVRSYDFVCVLKDHHARMCVSCMKRMYMCQKQSFWIFAFTNKHNIHSTQINTIYILTWSHSYIQVRPCMHTYTRMHTNIHICTHNYSKVEHGEHTYMHTNMHACMHAQFQQSGAWITFNQASSAPYPYLWWTYIHIHTDIHVCMHNSSKVWHGSLSIKLPWTYIHIHTYIHTCMHNYS